MEKLKEEDKELGCIGGLRPNTTKFHLEVEMALTREAMCLSNLEDKQIKLILNLEKAMIMVVPRKIEKVGKALIDGNMRSLKSCASRGGCTFKCS